MLTSAAAGEARAMAAAASNNVRISHPSREEFWVEALFDAVRAGLGEILEEPKGKILLVGGELLEVDPVHAGTIRASEDRAN
jgi:hypothetical protein